MGVRNLRDSNRFVCLEIRFSSSGSLRNDKKELVNRGINAMYEVLKRDRFHNLSIKCQLELFDSMVKPIIFYGC